MHTMIRFSMKNFRFVIFIAFLVWPSDNVSCIAKQHKHWRHRKASVSMLETDANSPTTFNVLRYGAKGDGIADDTKAFEEAWAAACGVEGSTVVVPSGSVFLVKPVSFSGPNCQSNIVFQLDGKIIAPKSSGAWGSGLLQWIEFTKLKGITIRGAGIIDGQGSVWWKDDNPVEESDANNSSEDSQIYADAAGGMPSTKPTALRFYGSSNVIVTGITIQNSPQTHLKFDDCTGVQVFSMSISSPGDSPNTDGIHLQNSKNVIIHSTSLACGDDCVSIQTGCSGVYIHNVRCGPGHGISIGGLGKDGTKACVSNITVRDSSLQNTMTGVRIKTWQGGSGSVQGVMFSNIQVSGVETPIMIDQYYCNGHKCQNKTSAVDVSGISYQFIKGTYTSKPVHFACSDSMACTGVTLENINLTPLQEKNQLEGPFCWHTFGELRTSTTPPITCLQRGDPSNKQVHNNGDSC
ncbi:Pectin lyase-like superfamily protein [Forsythia ovata]|uniref:Pectin lyase-like superfamily protein n=1 Tax=Forsythia ovata TaxID=205694 RepID=A0ABD1WRZ6_9LAMI